MDDRPQPLMSGSWVVGLLASAGLLYAVYAFGEAVGLHPFWIMASLPVLVAVGTVGLVLGAMWVGARRRRRAFDRERRGQCVKCGYDLRGARHDFCPECAMPVVRRRHPVTGEFLDG